MWIPARDVLPVKGEFKVKLFDGSEVIAFYTGFDFINTHTKKIIPMISHWFKDKRT